MTSAELTGQLTGSPTGDLLLASGGTKGLVIELIGFAVLVAILARWIVPLILKMMSQAQERIAKQLADSEAAGQKLAEAQAAYDNAVAEARAEAEKLRADARAQNEQIVAEAAAAAQARADEITQRATEALEAERISAVRSLQAEIATMAVDLAEQQVRTALQDDAVQRRVIDRFLGELEGGISNAGSAPAGSTGGRSA
ncbi:F0F1 ATP synthase subunit B [Sporichthya polymorpha]|uniref:F0F1 ATP synthase subunit B n=1 Tax=Sporichthya polymorpha TaxID=35751 RepID=UPI000362500B|nr:F0F1 ATP synthase subunit B [Sporichthya polymorpha]